MKGLHSALIFSLISHPLSRRLPQAESSLRIKSESERKLTIDLDDALEQVAFHVTEIEDLQAKVNDASRAKDEELKEVRMDKK
jgi:hypothetical protein